MNKVFDLVNFGKIFGKSTTPNAVKVIKTMQKIAN